MYITCQQCSTIFRLDESLLKPTGSKVRCSQCRNVFVEYPPISEPAETLSDTTIAAVTEAVAEPVSEASFDQELEGIDLDELDSILEQGGGVDEPELQDEMAELVTTPVDHADVEAELDEADLDMDFDLDFDSEENMADEGAGEVAEGALDTMDLEMDFEIATEEDDAVGEPEVQAEESADDLDLDLENMDFSLDADVAVEADDALEVDEVDVESPDEEAGGFNDFDLDLEETSDALDLEVDQPEMVLDADDDLLLDMDEAEDVAPEVAEDGEDDFDLGELDDLLGLDDEPEAKTTDVQAEEESPELTLEDDGEALLDFDATVDTPSAAADEGSKADDGGDDFDLAELDDMLGGDDSPGKVSAGASRDIIDENDELSLDDSMDEEIDKAPADLPKVESTDDSEELELSDLDAMLDEVDGPSDQDDELEGLQLESESDEDPGLEDLDFELDAEFEDKPIAQSDDKNTDEVTPEDEEIDLSDIEDMLSDDDEALDTQQLEADFLGLDGDGGEKWAQGEAAPELDLDDTDEIDLDEIEAAIDMADAEPVDDTIRLGDISDEELSLDDDDSVSLELEDDLVLELESDDEVLKVEDQPADDELDLSDLDLGSDHESTGTSEVIDAGDIELEFQIEDDEPAMDRQEDASVTAGAQEKEKDFSIEDTVPAPDAATTLPEVEEPLKPKKAKGGGIGLLSVLIVLLLGGAGYIYYAVTYMGMDIPYVTQFLKPAPKDTAGVLRLSTLDINSKFVDSESSGRLFVIEGKVRNGYSDGRKLIRLQGKLFTKGKVLSKTEFAYAGVNISAQELQSLPVAELKKRLNSGIAQGGATKVAPGSSLPFVVVFSELPDQLDEFAIEVISSMPSK